MKRRKDPVSIEEIVYLDADLHTYKYFMTGQYDADARKRDQVAQAQLEDSPVSDRSNEIK